MSKKNKSITYTLAVPLLSNDFRVKFTKKTEWTIIDYLFIKELSEHDVTLDQMSVKANLPKQLTLQILLPLCEIGWVYITSQNNQFIFRLTAAGKKIYTSSKEKHELPGILSSYTRNREVHVDDFDNYYDFYKIGITPINQNRFVTLQEELKEKLVVMQSSQSSLFPNYDKIKKAVKTANTEVNDVDDLHNFKIDFRKYLLLDMIYKKHNKSQIVDDRFKNFLGKNLIEAIENTVPNNVLPTQSKFTMINNSSLDDDVFIRELAKDSVDFIYDKEPTKSLFIDFIENANDYLIIHSTFIGKWAIKTDNEYTETFIKLKEALKREVKIYILWGKTKEEDDEKKKDEDEAIKQQLMEFNTTCKSEQMINVIDFNNFVRTDSHAKFLITNYANRGNCIVLSSCNFLYSNFNRFEASIVVQDDIFTKKMLEIAANLACGKNPYNTDVRTNIRIIANNIADCDIKERITIPKSDLLTVTLVLKGEHYKYVDMASDNAKRRIYITSDLISEIPQRPIYHRLANCQTSQKCLFYTKLSKIEPETIKGITQELKEFRPPIKLRKSSNNNHSKVLAWDSDNILVTSLNWLSANALSRGEYYHEIGLHVRGKNVANTFIDYFKTKN